MGAIKRIFYKENRKRRINKKKYDSICRSELVAWLLVRAAWAGINLSKGEMLEIKGALRKQKASRRALLRFSESYRTRERLNFNVKAKHVQSPVTGFVKSVMVSNEEEVKTSRTCGKCLPGVPCPIEGLAG